MKYLLIILGITIFFGLSGCGYKEGVNSEAQKSYLYFSGKVEGVKVSIDEGAMFSVKPGRDHQYKINPGKHSVKVFRGDAMIVNREVFVGDGIAKEIDIH
jgi:hypothetical protein